MLTLDMLIYVIGCVTLLVGLMWGVSEITAYLLLAHYDWKLRRNTKVIVTNSETP
jgi:hypothetical protein